MALYLVFRNGSNAANQSMRNRAPVAIVEAPNQTAACATDGPERPSLHSPPCWLALAPNITAWANQWFDAVPVSRARAADVREVEEA